MHPIQESLLKLIDQKNIGDLTLRGIGSLIGEKFPQKIKNHLQQLEKKGFILIDKKNKKINRINKNFTDKIFISIPIVGAANCGPATLYADQNVEGYIKVSKRIIPKNKNTYAIKAEGNSLNKANIHGKNIESGDFVIIDNSGLFPANNDYVVSIIDGLAIIKKYRIDPKNERILLVSESTQDYPPILVHEKDNFHINGKVIDVIKKP